MFFCVSRLVGFFLIAIGSGIILASFLPLCVLMVIEGFIIVIAGLMLIKE